MLTNQCIAFLLGRPAHHLLYSADDHGRTHGTGLEEINFANDDQLRPKAPHQNDDVGVIWDRDRLGARNIYQVFLEFFHYGRPPAWNMWDEHNTPYHTDRHAGLHANATLDEQIEYFLDTM